MLFPVLAVVNKSAVNRVTREDHIKQSWSCNAVYLAGLDSNVRLLRNYSVTFTGILQCLDTWYRLQSFVNTIKLCISYLLEVF